MTEPYLILHKVRGEPAFDIAVKVQVGTQPGWIEEWWIIPTSGHRAYPAWFKSLEELGLHRLPDGNIAWGPSEAGYTGLLPLYLNTVPDHYAINEAPKPKPPSQVPSATIDDFLI